ncbi:hypothetical protein WJX79_007442 [Trebouxia sp. C0005]
MDQTVVSQPVQQQLPVKVLLMIPCTDAIVIWAGTTENSAKFRVTTPIKEVLQKLKQRWGNGMRIDSEGFEVTPSSPHLQPGRYEYTRIPPGGMPYHSALPHELSARPPNSRQARDAELCDKAKSGVRWKLRSLALSTSESTHRVYKALDCVCLGTNRHRGSLEPMLKVWGTGNYIRADSHYEKVFKK